MSDPVDLTKQVADLTTLFLFQMVFMDTAATIPIGAMAARVTDVFRIRTGESGPDAP
jgi:hypothetical protein